MLVLSRKNQEVIRIGPDIRVTVVHIGNGRVRLGIDAPDVFVISREETPERAPVTRKAGTS